MNKKAKQKFAEKNKGYDRIPGRPVRINYHQITANRDTYAELIFWGDVHLGYPTSNIRKAKDMLQYVLDNKAYIITMGDLMESGLTESPGGSVYRQKLNPQKQLESVVRMLQPVANEGLILGFHTGNHEQRVTNSTGIDVSKLMARLLGVRYLGYACWSVLALNGIRYSIYSQHGKSGSRFKHTKLKALIDQAAWINSDVIAMGHVHSLAAEPIIQQRYDRSQKKIVNEKQLAVLTGSYLEWDDSYAQMGTYPITKLGSPKIKLIATEKDVHGRV